MKTRIVFGGCRYYNDYEVFSKYADTYIDKIGKNNGIIILSGHCLGVDMLAEKYARQHNYKLEIYSAEWDKFGKAAGPIRNKKMVENSDLVIAFWDFKSKGTKNLISISKKLNKEIIIIDISDKTTIGTSN